ncbi:hypothetical protein Tco_0334965 [Tanacetum coccineum]
MDDSLIVSKGSLIEPENNNAFSKSEIETQMQRQEEKVNMREAVDAGLVVTESSGTKPDKQNTSSSSGSYTTQAVDADIGPVNDEEPFAEVDTYGKVVIDSTTKVTVNRKWFKNDDIQITPYDANQTLYVSAQRSLLHDNIVPKPDLALELGKSISLTEAEEEAIAREVHATHANVSSTKPSSLVTPPPINTEATTIIHTILPENHSNHRLQQRVEDRIRDVEVRRTDHSCRYLIEKYSALHGLKSIKNQESEKSLNRKTRFNLLHQFNCRRRLPWIRKVAVKVVKTTRENQVSDDEEDDDDDEGPSAGSNQGSHDASAESEPSHSSKKLKGIQTLTPAEQEAADIMKALKESKKMSKRQPGTGGSNEGTGNILGVPDESTVISRASSEGTGSKPGVPDEEKLIL